MNMVEVHLDDASLVPEPVRVGHLFRDASRRGDILRFEYDADWPARPDAFEIDPLLPLREGPFHAADPAQPPNVFQDCSPDRWGRLLMDRREAIEAREEDRPRRTLRAWDYLTGVDDGTRMGALRLRDPDTGRFVASLLPSAPPMTSLRELEAAARLVEQGAGAQVDTQIRQLIVPGGSLGGARPKASFVDERGELWLAKFPSTEDRHDVGLWEFVAWKLAIAAGIRMPEARLLPLSSRGHTFAVKRFDRIGASRRMYASAKTLLDVDSNGASYLDLVAAVEGQGAGGTIADGLEQLFRRAVFNVLVGNRDDHLRNHGFLREPSGWVLSPAFDVNPNPDKDVHVLALDDADPTPDTRVLVAQHAFFRLDAGQAAHIVEEVRRALRPWAREAQASGANRQELSLLGAVIDPER
ncbi:type II toxin-antitoxin system HipA family toxin [Luteimonas sp. BDR2-5]|uniref:type II toxin-antitoxin system HipA family toxin n=1 Tax=Proluteimonas luteida TaxID=2878685 RepID=UPI001E5A1E29|nr:type II toxin-antitoxin system HipA family toxin [Luteimonas sp. BDR2-5]MCD9029535.1 type II toxin-antitoxin system HipA family toxin [Luteimonas sp. BDR2-5]